MCVPETVAGAAAGSHCSVRFSVREAKRAAIVAIRGPAALRASLTAPPRSDPGDWMRSPKDFFRPLAVGAPTPVREIPFRPSRMIHFFDPGNEKMAAKVPSIAAQVDVLLGNLEDAVQADRK